MKKREQNIKHISRNIALKKMGKYAALTAIGTFFILNPRKSQAQSFPPPKEGGDDSGNLFN